MFRRAVSRRRGRVGRGCVSRRGAEDATTGVEFTVVVVSPLVVVQTTVAGRLTGAGADDVLVATAAKVAEVVMPTMVGVVTAARVVTVVVPLVGAVPPTVVVVVIVVMDAITVAAVAPGVVPWWWR